MYNADFVLNVLINNIINCCLKFRNGFIKFFDSLLQSIKIQIKKNDKNIFNINNKNS